MQAATYWAKHPVVFAGLVIKIQINNDNYSTFRDGFVGAALAAKSEAFNLEMKLQKDSRHPHQCSGLIQPLIKTGKGDRGL